MKLELERFGMIKPEYLMSEMLNEKQGKLMVWVLNART
jgi:hypothetical protein